MPRKNPNFPSPSKTFPPNPKPFTSVAERNSQNSHINRNPKNQVRRRQPTGEKSNRTMKIRTIKLREAHKNGENGGNSFCSILWDQQGDRIVTASSSAPSIWVHDAQFPSVNPKSIKHHRDGVTALALSPNFTCLASGSIDHSVKLYKFPGNKNEQLI